MESLLQITANVKVIEIVVTMIEICKLRNSWSNFNVESLLQIAANVKVIEIRLKQVQRNLK